MIVAVSEELFHPRICGQAHTNPSRWSGHWSATREEEPEVVDI